MVLPRIPMHFQSQNHHHFHIYGQNYRWKLDPKRKLIRKTIFCGCQPYTDLVCKSSRISYTNMGDKVHAVYAMHKDTHTYKY